MNHRGITPLAILVVILGMLTVWLTTVFFYSAAQPPYQEEVTSYVGKAKKLVSGLKNTNARAREVEYFNKNLGFRLRFPASWKGFKETAVVTKEYRYVAFTLPKAMNINGVQTKVEFSVFRIENSKTVLPPESKLITEEGSVRFAWAPTSTKAPTGLEKQWEEIDDIIATFEIL